MKYSIQDLITYLNLFASGKTRFDRFLSSQDVDDINEVIRRAIQSAQDAKLINKTPENPTK